MPLLVALLAAAGLGLADETPAQCQAAYQAEFASLWEIQKADWDAACASGRQSDELLRTGQRAFQKRCRQAFSEVKDKGPAPETVQAYCAQGVPGRRRLKSDLGLPSEDAPPPGIERASPGDAEGDSKPGEHGMGPLSEAVRTARDRWGKDACMTAMLYYSREGTFNREKGKYRSDLKPYSAHVEAYYYYFWAPAKPQASPVVAYFDVVDEAFCMITDRLKGPEFDDFVKSTGNDCLERVDVAAPDALQLAAKGGVDLSEGVEAYLFSPGSWSFLYDRCERGLRLGTKTWCRKGLSRRQRGRLARRSLWVIATPRKMAFIDAAEPKVLFTTGREMSLIDFQNTGSGLMAPGLCRDSQRRSK